MSSARRASGLVRAAADVISSITSGASTVALCPVSRFENRSTSRSNRSRISSTVDFLSGAFRYGWDITTPTLGSDTRLLTLDAGARSGALDHGVRRGRRLHPFTYPFRPTVIMQPYDYANRDGVREITWDEFL